MDTGNSRGSIVSIAGTRGHLGRRLHISPDPQDELVLRDHIVWKIRHFYWADLISLRDLPLGKADVRECFVVDGYTGEETDMHCIISRQGNTFFFKVAVVKGRYRREVWSGSTARNALLERVRRTG